MRFACAVGVSYVLLLGSIIPPADASVVHSASGTSAKGVPVTFEAELTIVGDVLTVILTNDSPVATLNPDDVLGSYYFDILDDLSNRPSLTYLSATGDLYLPDKNGPDLLLALDADIQAIVPGDDSWQFRDMDASQTPSLGFGLGTVGNNGLSPNGFMGNIVDGIDYSIYKGDITTANLHNKALVKDTATFTFSGLTGFTEDDISPAFAFGLGTAPDSLLTPEPASALLLAAGALCLLRRKRVR